VTEAKRTVTDGSIRISKDDLLKFAADIFVAAGIDRATADAWTKVLVWANLRGVDSHGVIRIPRYLDLIGKKAINPRPNMPIERRAGAIAVLEADRAPGPIAMLRAVDEAIERARETHVGWCAARNITHAGAIGYYALKVAECSMAGIVMAASGPMMAYHGARAAGVSTNPIAIAVPAKAHRPYLIDMSTSTVSNGKILNAKDSGKSGSDRLGHRRRGPRRHRPAQDQNPPAARRAEGVGPVVHDRMPGEPGAGQSAHRPGLGARHGVGKSGAQRRRHRGRHRGLRQF
jgi:ureidoglycolate dehydrogenase (NAD+)